MSRRFLVLLVTVITLLALSVVPASAHVNDAAGKGVGPPPHANVQGHGHGGMECGAQNPNTPLQPLGLPCPAGS
jgi:hypothetical protein